MRDPKVGTAVREFGWQFDLWGRERRGGYCVGLNWMAYRPNYDRVVWASPKHTLAHLIALR
jgi:hypothetical protein